jgi:hypothetical protein
MNARRFRQPAPSEAFVAFRWLGWVMLMMFVLVQIARGTAEAPKAQADTSGPWPAELSQASAQFDPATHQVTVEAAAPAKLWNATPDIGAHSFAVYEDNVRQPIEDVEAVDVPLSIGLLLEHGGRYHFLNEVLADTGSRAVQELKAARNPDDKMTVWTYGNAVEPLQTSSETPAGLQLTTVQVPVAPSSESNFYDAVLTVLPRVQQMAGRKVLFVVSSGIDTFSQADFPQVLRAAENSGVPICPINIGPLLQAALPAEGGGNDVPYGHRKWQLAAQQLSRLARVSGCRALTPGSALDLPAVYDGLLANLRLKYVIRYRSTALGLPGTREVRVEWTDGNRAPTRVARANVHSDGGGKVLADARYTVDTGAVFSKPTALTGPFLPFSRDPAAQLPWKNPFELDGRNDGLLAATRPNELGRVEPGEARDGPLHLAPSLD